MTASIKWNKKGFTVVQTVGNVSKVYTAPKSTFAQVIKGFDSFDIIVQDTTVKKVAKIISDSGFSVDIDTSYGFDWDVKITAS